MKENTLWVILTGWLSLVLFNLVMVGLAHEKMETICASWVAHMFANFAINTIGFILMG